MRQNFSLKVQKYISNNAEHKESCSQVCKLLFIDYCSFRNAWVVVRKYLVREWMTFVFGKAVEEASAV